MILTIIKLFFLFCLNDCWVIQLLFSKFNSMSYDKKYQISKTKLKHTIYYNKKFTL